MPTTEDEILSPWPAIADQLFRQKARAFDAYLAVFEGERHFRMQKGFKLAADLLTRHTEEETRERDNLIWPIVFCYRQYIELALKQAIERYGGYLSPPVEPNWRDHGLMRLWDSYKLIVAATLSSGDAGEIPEVPIVETCLKQFDALDPKSYVFRYPTDTSGSQNKIPLSSVDLVNLHDVMQGIYTFFDTGDAMLQVHFEATWP